MCKLLALLELLANNNTKASAITSAVVSTARFSDLQCWNGGVAEAQHSPEVNTLISLSTIGVITTVSIVNGSLTSSSLR